MQPNDVKLEKDESFFGQLLGRTWIFDLGAGENAARKSRTRFTDLDGYSPSPQSVLRLPASIWSKWRHRSQLLMSDPMPWLVYDAISFLEDKVGPDCRILEVGGGNSSIWFLQKGAWVTSFESDELWAEAIKSRVNDDPKIQDPSRHTLVNRAGDDAIEYIAALEDQAFDIALIDSVPERIPRGAALRAARPKLKPGGFMVLDNSDSPAHKDGIEAMADKTLLRFSGFTPMRLRVSQTSLWQV